MKPVYDVDGITIYHADCADVLPGIDPSTVGLLLTDPPYGIDLNTDYARAGGVTYPQIVGDSEPFNPSALLTFGRVVLFGANRYTEWLPNGEWIIWRKRGAAYFMAAAELAWHNCDGHRGRVDYFETTYAAARSEDGHLHPAQKPVALMRWILEKWTEPGDLILDPYMGSGPVARACADLGRRYIGIEIVEEYVEAAINRLGQTAFDLNQ